MPKADRTSRDRNCIGHILKYCKQLEETLGEIDHSKERFMDSHTYQNAIAMCILQVDELTKKLSTDFLKEHAVIPWSLIAKTRDTYAHHYGAADFDLVWDTAIEDIPMLQCFCEDLLSQ